MPVTRSQSVRAGRAYGRAATRRKSCLADSLSEIASKTLAQLDAECRKRGADSAFVDKRGKVCCGAKIGDQEWKRKMQMVADLIGTHDDLDGVRRRLRKMQKDETLLQKETYYTVGVLKRVASRVAKIASTVVEAVWELSLDSFRGLSKTWMWPYVCVLVLLYGMGVHTIAFSLAEKALDTLATYYSPVAVANANTNLLMARAFLAIVPIVATLVVPAAATGAVATGAAATGALLLTQL